jgi:hypothetical protein
MVTPCAFRRQERAQSADGTRHNLYLLCPIFGRTLATAGPPSGHGEALAFNAAVLVEPQFRAAAVFRNVERGVTVPLGMRQGRGRHRHVVHEITQDFDRPRIHTIDRHDAKLPRSDLVDPRLHDSLRRDKNIQFPQGRPMAFPIWNIFLRESII